MTPRGTDTGVAEIAELRRVATLFQARSIAAALGAPMPDPAKFLRTQPLNEEKSDGL